MSAERERKRQESLQKEQEQMRPVHQKFNMTQGWTNNSFFKNPSSKALKASGRQQSMSNNSTLIPPEPTQGMGAKSRSIAALNTKLPTTLNPKFASTFQNDPSSPYLKSSSRISYQNNSPMPKRKDDDDDNIVTSIERIE